MATVTELIKTAGEAAIAREAEGMSRKAAIGLGLSGAGLMAGGALWSHKYNHDHRWPFKKKKHEKAAARMSSESWRPLEKLLVSDIERAAPRISTLTPEAREIEAALLRSHEAAASSKKLIAGSKAQDDEVTKMLAAGLLK